MKGLSLCVFAIMMLPPAKGEEKAGVQLFESDAIEEGVLLECFRCDLGFWDACFTTTTTCEAGERCYTGKGKAADTLDVKTLGCVKAEECDVENTVELFLNSTIFVMTKHCCNTPLCNSAHKLPHVTLLSLTVAVLTTWHLSEASTRAQ